MEKKIFRTSRSKYSRGWQTELSAREFKDYWTCKKTKINLILNLLQDVKKLAIKYSAEKAADQSQIKQLKQMNDNYKSEISKLYELMDQRKEDFENLNAEVFSKTKIIF